MFEDIGMQQLGTAVVPCPDCGGPAGKHLAPTANNPRRHLLVCTSCHSTWYKGRQPSEAKVRQADLEQIHGERYKQMREDALKRESQDNESRKAGLAELKRELVEEEQKNGRTHRNGSEGHSQGTKGGHLHLVEADPAVSAGDDGDDGWTS